VTQIAEGTRLNALLTLKGENYLAFPVGTRLSTMSVMEWKFILPVKH
jgi:hypothetical protein